MERSNETFTIKNKDLGNAIVFRQVSISSRLCYLDLQCWCLWERQRPSKTNRKENTQVCKVLLFRSWRLLWDDKSHKLNKFQSFHVNDEWIIFIPFQIMPSKTNASRMEYIIQYWNTFFETVLCDFAENYQFLVHNEIQSYHWSRESFCFISNDNTHDTSFVYKVQTLLI